MIRRAFIIALPAGAACLAEDPPAPVVAEAVAPNYPALAVLGRISGSVVVQVHISPKGTVAAVNVIEGDALLRQASLEAARLWRFEPQPAAREVKLIFSYRLMPKNTSEAETGTVFRPPFTVEIRKINPGPVSHVARNRPQAPGPDRR